MSEYVNLFGETVLLAARGRGRPPHEPSTWTRNRVTLLVVMGYANELIADIIGISAPTLRRCYKAELEARPVARMRLDLRRMEKLVEGMNDGNVGAIKELGKQLEKLDMTLAEKRVRDRAKTEAPAEERLGKKAQRLENAKRAVGEGRFAVPPAPRLVQ
ncbi:hypothetical protein [Aureimonas sp. ME7]|uniref:hypothetical protein n=1 Tax=Aureimonas sp. ME7 TaxID=2744252 RepID=UPI0015FE4EFD|nr:hypothetical protein [Aureimonas sp. ME7]